MGEQDSRAELSGTPRTATNALGHALLELDLGTSTKILAFSMAQDAETPSEASPNSDDRARRRGHLDHVQEHRKPSSLAITLGMWKGLYRIERPVNALND